MSQSGTLDFTDIKSHLRSLAIFALPLIISHQGDISLYMNSHFGINATYIALFFSVIVDIGRRMMKDTSTSNAIMADNSTETPLETPKISPVSEYIAGTQEDVKPQEELSSGSSIGVFKPVSDDFQKSLGNQTVVSRMCCQTFAFVQSMCIMDGIPFDYAVLKNAWNKGKMEGKFGENTGGYMVDGAYYAIQFYNSKYNTTWKATSFLYTPDMAVEKMALNNSPIIFALRGSPQYFKDEQDNGSIDYTFTPGKLGHCVTLIKANNTDSEIGVQGKYVENYYGSDKFEVIYENMTKLYTRGLIQFTAFYLTK